MPISYALRAADPARTRSDAVFVGIVASKKGPVVAPGGESVASAFGKKWAPTLANLSVSGKAGEVVKVPTGGLLNASVLVLVGLGAHEVSAVPTDALRAAAGAAARVTLNASSVAVALPADTPERIAALTEGWLLGGYTFDRYKKKTNSHNEPGSVSFLSAEAKKVDAVAAFARAQRLADLTSGVRDWVNTPPADLTPPAFADSVSEQVAAWRKPLDKDWKKAGATLTLEVFDEQQLADLGCGGILGVGAGSAAPPRMVRLTWTPADPVAHLALVGKGVTYDSGGLTIKPAGSMHTMKSDMAGAASVLNATRLIAELGLPLKVSAWAPMAENMISGSAFRPGDVLTLHNGLTTEIRNTDAEGRLLLGDALPMAVAESPDVVLDVATLTGHMVTALGDRITGVLGDEEVVAQVLAAGAEAGEAMWPMPITDEVKGRVKTSPVADLLQHDWVRWGGGLMAAAWLQHFVASVPWGHLDIAGPSFVPGARGHLTAGATGVGLATVVRFAEDLVARSSADA